MAMAPQRPQEFADVLFTTGFGWIMEDRDGFSSSRIVAGDETSRLGNFAKTHSRYGSTARNISRPQKHTKHIVSPSDTLQGLSLKYGVSVSITINSVCFI